MSDKAKMYDTGAMLMMSKENFEISRSEYCYRLEADMLDWGLSKGVLFLPVMRGCREVFYEAPTYWGAIVSFSADFFNRQSDMFERILIKTSR